MTSAQRKWKQAKRRKELLSCLGVHTLGDCDAILTVAMPLFRAGPIAWVALESLIRQTGINFKWELVAAEEVCAKGYKNVSPLGFAKLSEYFDKLKKVGCCRLVYIGLDHWVPLGDKWVLIATYASKSSKVFSLQSADCWSGPERLVLNKQLLWQPPKNYFSWTHGVHHVLYDIVTGKSVIYTISKPKSEAGCDMALRTDIVRKMPIDHRRKGVDTWLMDNCVKMLGSNRFSVAVDDSKGWRSSMNVHGINNISSRRSIFFKNGATNKKNLRVRIKLDPNIRKFIPAFVFKRLEKLKNKAKRWGKRPWGKGQ